jgi:hypothetical protein
MINKNLYIAKVVNNNDLEKKGRVQIRIPIKHGEIKETFLPWALPFHNFIGGSASHGINCIPENDSFVWVFYEDEDSDKNPFFIADVNTHDLSCASLYDTDVKSKIGASSSYPDMKFIYLPNGICIGASSSMTTPEIIIFNPVTGGDSFIHMKSDGSVIINNHFKVEL